MLFALNWYSIDFHVVVENGPPMPDARLEDHPFGVPLTEMRKIWILDIPDLESLFELVIANQAILNLSLSDFWTGGSLENPGERLFGIAMYDDFDRIIDPRDRPVQIVPSSGDDENGAI